MSLTINCLQTIHNHHRVSSITRSLHTVTWVYFTSCLPDIFSRSPIGVKEAIMTDINDFVEEFSGTSSDQAVWASCFALCRLFEFLQRCSEILVCFSILVTAVNLTDVKIIRRQQFSSTISPSQTLMAESETNFTTCFLGIDSCLISYYLNPKNWLTCSGSYLVS